MFKRLTVLLAIAVVATAVAVARAGASTSGAAARILSLQSLEGGNAAIVTVRYSCVDPNTHLWVSAKQSADGSRDPRLELPGSSQYAATWLQRHPEHQLICDTREHTGSFRINKSEYGFGALVAGQAWVQFCMTWPIPGTDDFNVSMTTRWVTVS